jgi:hypothetical protein
MRWHSADRNAEPQYGHDFTAQLHRTQRSTYETHMNAMAAIHPDVTVLLPQPSGDRTLGYLHLDYGKISAANQPGLKAWTVPPCDVPHASLHIS